MPAHARSDRDTGWVLKIAALATLVFFAVELAAGSYARSLALVSDAWHNFSDALAALVTWFAFYVQTRAPSQSKTYGYHRAGVLAALVAALFLLALVGVLFYFGSQRLLAPPQPNTLIMLVLGGAGMAMNGLISGALRGASRGRACPRKVLIHIVGDALAAIGIIVVALLIRAAGLRALDPILALLIAGLTAWTAWEIVAESLNILLEGLPRGLELKRVEEAIRSVSRIEDVHDLHIWSLGADSQALSCHVRIPQIPLPESEAILSEVNAVLARRFQISHTTIQLEHDECEAMNGCVIPSTSPGQQHSHSH